MFGLLTRGAKRSETAHLNILEPEIKGPITEWYEAALCDREEDTGKLRIVKIRRAIEPEVTFTEDDGIDPSTEYTAIYRKVRIDQHGGLLYGDWSDTTGWDKPFERPE